MMDRIDLAAISGDGSTILTVLGVGTAQVRDSRSEELLAELRPRSPLEGGDAWGHSPFQTFIEAAALNHNGSRAVLGLNDGTAATWSIPGETRIAVLHAPDRQPAQGWEIVRAVTFSPDSSLVAAGFYHREVGVWADGGRRLVASLRAPPGARMVTPYGIRDMLVTSLAITRDNRFVFAGAADLTAAIWEIATSRLVFEATDHAEQIIALSDDGERVLWATTGGNVWMATESDGARKLLATGAHWAEVAFHGSVLLARSFDGSVSRWELTGARRALFRPASFMHQRRDDVVSLGFATKDRFFHPEGEDSLAVHHNGIITHIEHGVSFSNVRFTPARTAVAMWGGSKPGVQIWSIDGALSRTFGSGGASCVAFSPDGRWIAVAEGAWGQARFSCSVSLYDLRSGSLDRMLPAHRWPVSHACFSADSGRLAMIDGDELVIWRLRDCGWCDPRSVFQTRADSEARGIQFLCDGRLLLLEQNGAHVIDGETERLSFPVRLRSRTAWTIDDEGTYLTISTNQGFVRHDLTSGECVASVHADVQRPERLNPAELAAPAACRPWALLWQTPFGIFVHESEYPRGYLQPITVSEGGLLVVPSQSGAIVVSASDPHVILRSVRFHGPLRASRIVAGQVLVVNADGKLLRFWAR